MPFKYVLSLVMSYFSYADYCRKNDTAKRAKKSGILLSMFQTFMIGVCYWPMAHLRVSFLTLLGRKVCITDIHNKTMVMMNPGLLSQDILSLMNKGLVDSFSARQPLYQLLSL